METLANFIDKNRDNITDLYEKLVEQQKYQKCKKDGIFIYDYVKAIREITDTKMLDALIEKCHEIDDELNWKTSAKNISTIKKEIAHNVCEMELLNTLHKMQFSCYRVYVSTVNFDITYTLNGCDFHDIVKQRVDANNKKTFIKVGSGTPTNCDTIEIRAFQSAMTLHEYTTFTNNISLVMLKHISNLLKDHYNPHYAPTVNIANLLLCAMNEQEQNDVTLMFATMSLAERVLYDEFLLKCITMLRTCFP